MRAICPSHLAHLPCFGETFSIPRQIFSPCYRIMDDRREKSQIRLWFLVPAVLGRHDFFGVGGAQEFQEGLRSTRDSGSRYCSRQQRYTFGSASIYHHHRRHHHYRHEVLGLLVFCSKIVSEGNMQVFTQIWCKFLLLFVTTYLITECFSYRFPEHDSCH